MAKKSARRKPAKKESEDSCVHRKMGGLLIPAGLFLGFGLGFLLNNVPAGMFLGLGAGFVGFFASRMCRCGCC